MTIQHLEYVVALSQTLNFTKAANYMNITQPALSRIVSSVEQELGFAIFDRSRRNVQLTPAGKTFVVAAHKSLQFYHSGIERSLSAPSEHVRPLTIGYIADGFNSDLRDLITLFKREYPNYPILLGESRYYEIYEGLANEKWDLVYYTASPDPIPEEIETQLLEPYELYVALHPGHPLADRISLEPMELASEPFIELCYHKTYSRTWNMLQYVSKVAGFVPTVAHQGSTISSMMLQVQAGQGVAFITKATMSHWSSFGQSGVRVVPIENIDPMQRRVAWHAENMHPGLHSFVEHVTTHYNHPAVVHYQH